VQEIVVWAVGNVASDVRFVALDSGVHRARFRLASTPRRLDRDTGQWTDATTSYVTVTCWRTLADNVASALNKGDPVVVVGRASVRDWERDERKGSTLEIDASAIGPDLARVPAVTLRRAKPEPVSAAAFSGGGGGPQRFGATAREQPAGTAPETPAVPTPSPPKPAAVAEAVPVASAAG
jgi:single-strand DNA-binding protein